MDHPAPLFLASNQLNATEKVPRRRVRRNIPEVIEILEAAYNENPNPSTREYTRIWEKIKEVSPDYPRESLKRWFKRMRKDGLTLCTRPPALASGPSGSTSSSSCPSLNDSVRGWLEHVWQSTAPTAREPSYDVWCNSPIYLAEGATPQDIRQWLLRRETLDRQAAARALTKLGPGSASTSRLGLDTTAPISAALAQRAYHSPAPTDVVGSPMLSSADPDLWAKPEYPLSGGDEEEDAKGITMMDRGRRPTASAGQSECRLPTPACSRSTSLALEPEPMHSPVITFHAELPVVLMTGSASSSRPILPTPPAASVAPDPRASSLSSSSSFPDPPMPLSPLPIAPASTSQGYTPISVRILRELKTTLENEDSMIMEPIPMNYADFAQGMAPYEEKMIRSLNQLRNLSQRTGMVGFSCLRVQI
ncbi:unnamed protein product [Mycena citricolor]|uniref:Uncharacterized protein n=1 Tax=Mycena citricolor TaxID=2018698 RepID=A0AAD2HW87_9AGAR|nr:unnamed protein product [Mycena citricolor]